jgi:class 3 adenylate cyclase
VSRTPTPPGAPTDTERLTAQVRALEDELERLREGLRLTLTAGLGSATAVGGTYTISGLEEMVLLVNPDGTLGYVNAPMARLLGVEDRKAALGDPLAAHDRGPLGRATLEALVTAAQATGQPVVVERAVPDLPRDRLPRTPGRQPVGPPVLRFAAVPVKGRVQLTVQDVSWLRWLESTFSRYVAPEVIAQMVTRSEAEFLGMQRREITMLYADLRGFTRITEELPLPVLQEIMRDYLTAMQTCVERRLGMVGQFVGDEVVALFGAPVASDEHALLALWAAADMVRTHAANQARWAEAGWPQPGIGIGLATGEVAVGNMGTSTRMYYTALGHAMNLGARLCAQAGAGQILTVGRTHQLGREAIQRRSSTAGLPHLRFHPRGAFRFKNVADPVDVLEVVIVDGDDAAV